MKLKVCISVAILLITVVNAFTDLHCPDYQLRCPSCGPQEECVYPNSGGCPGAGIPVCKSTQCQTVRCKGLGKSCPKECPFSCNYDTSPCCPFTGEPRCEPVCNTLVACKVTPCPDDCPHECHYPDAFSCCPKSGKSVCKTKHDKRNGGLGYKSGGFPSEEWGISYSLQAQAWDPVPDEYPYGMGDHGYYGDQGYYSDGGYNDGYGQDYGNEHRHGRDHEHVHDSNCNHGHEGHGQEDHNHGDNDYFKGVFIGGLNTEHECHSCVKTITDIDLSLEFVTTTVQPEDVFCAQYIIPCPEECPDSCVYPTDQPCPFTLQPWCPNNFPHGADCSSVYPTDGYPFPYFPTYDPYYSTFNSLMNSSGVTATPSFVTDIAIETTAHACPLIFRYCPIECPDSCLRPDVPCPFAVDGYCPGDIPTTTISESALITPTADTVVGGGLVCPLYLLACPVCPEGYSCTRDSKGHCPNTNVPYCISTVGPQPTPVFKYNSGKVGSNRLAQSPKLSASTDICADAGYVKVSSKQVFDQLQEPRANCTDCKHLKWDEACPNTCIFSTEEDCCIQTLCLPN